MFTTYVYVFRRVPSNGELYKGVKEQSSYIFLIREYEQLYPPDCMIFDPAEEHLQDVQVHKLLSIMSEKDFFPDEKEIEAAEMVAIFIIPTKYTDQIPRVKRNIVKPGVLRKRKHPKIVPKESILEDLPKYI